MAVSSSVGLRIAPWLSKDCSLVFLENQGRHFLIRSPRVYSVISSASTCLEIAMNFRWESCRKKKVVLRVGYVGTDYKGLQLQRSESLPTIEKELKSAIYKAGGICDSNYGDLKKIKWARSSRTDKGVHSLATIITLKMEIPEDAWKSDSNGTILASYVNHHLPTNIKVFSILPSQRMFNARRECNYRIYSYFLPAEIIGIKNGCCADGIEEHLADFNEILKSFEGEHPFHNFTSRSVYQKSLPSKTNENAMASTYLEYSGEPSLPIEETGSMLDNQKDGSVNTSSITPLAMMKARWLHKPDEMDRLSSSHFRKIFKCSSGNLKTLYGLNYVEISIHGESFMLHQIRKMVGTAVAVKQRLLPRDVIELSLAKFSRFILPIAPSEVLVLRDSRVFSRKLQEKLSRPEMKKMEESAEIQDAINKYYYSVLLPQLSEFLDPAKSPWVEWARNLVSGAAISGIELDEVRKNMKLWQGQRKA